MAEQIWIRGQDGGFEGVKEETFSAERHLQELIAEHPELIDGEQVRPHDARRWILIAREKGIAETSDAGARWSLDHLIIDQDARPTLVEAKLRDNSDIHRKIVGQMLEYAAHASETWTADELRRAFEESARTQGRNPHELLAELLQDEDEPDADEFWERVSTNLAAKRLRLLFIADRIPDRLARVVEFLNGQMRDIEVLAVEVKRFHGSSGEMFVPRVIGRAAVRAINRRGSRASRSWPPFSTTGIGRQRHGCWMRLRGTEPGFAGGNTWYPSPPGALWGRNRTPSLGFARPQSSTVGHVGQRVSPTVRKPWKTKINATGRFGRF